MREERERQVLGCSRYPTCNRVTSWQAASTKLVEHPHGAAVNTRDGVDKEALATSLEWLVPKDSPWTDLVEAIYRRVQSVRVQEHGCRVVLIVPEGDFRRWPRLATVEKDEGLPTATVDRDVVISFSAVDSPASIRTLIAQRVRAAQRVGEIGPWAEAVLRPKLESSWEEWS